MKGLVVHVVIFNVLHLICGLVAFAITFVQFTTAPLPNIYVDFRYLNSIHFLTGIVGIFMVVKSYGSLAALTLYLVSFTLGGFTVGFYADALSDALIKYSDAQSYYAEADSGARELQIMNDEMSRVVVCSVMIAIGAIEFIISALSIVLLHRLARDQTSPRMAKYSHHANKNRCRVIFVAGVKIFFAIACICMGSYLARLMKKSDNYTKLVLDKLAAGAVLVSAMVDLLSLVAKQHKILNLKVGLIFSTASAVLSLKAMDFMMIDFDRVVKDYTNFDERFAQVISKEEKFDIFVLHACVAGCLVVLFFHCIISALESASGIERTNLLATMDGSNGRSAARLASVSLQLQRNFVGVLQFGWGVGLITIAVISFFKEFTFTSGYSGSKILWVGCLFLASGSVSSIRMRTLCSSIYVLAIVCCIVAMEHFMLTLHYIYQAVNSPEFNDEATLTHNGRIVMYSLQAGFLFLEALTALPTAVHFGKVLHMLPKHPSTQPEEGPVEPKLGKPQRCLIGMAVIHVVYALLAIGVTITGEVIFSLYRQYGIAIPAFVRSTNGVIVLACMVVQVMAAKRYRFLVPCCILNVISASIVFFVMPPCIGALYHTVQYYRLEIFEVSNANSMLRKRTYEWTIVINSIMTFILLVEFVTSVVSAMLCSYLLHHQERHEKHQGNGDVVRFNTLQQNGDISSIYQTRAPFAGAGQRGSSGSQIGLLLHGSNNGSEGSSQTRPRPRESLPYPPSRTHKPHLPQRYPNSIHTDPLRLYAQHMYIPPPIVKRQRENFEEHTERPRATRRVPSSGSSAIPEENYNGQDLYYLGGQKADSGSQTNIRHIFRNEIHGSVQNYQ